MSNGNGDFVARAADRSRGLRRQDRVFGTKKLAEITNDSDDEEELAIKEKLALINFAAPDEKVTEQKVVSKPTLNKKKNNQDELVDEE